MKRPPKKAQVTSLATANPNWPPPRHTSAKPVPTVRLIFAGLLGFCYRSDGICEVGFCKSTGHEPRIAIFEKPGCLATIVNPGSSAMSVGITGLMGTPSVTSLQEGSFDRYNGDDKDIRWLLDLADWYPSYSMQNGYFPQRLAVTHGMFFTHLKSNSTFNQVNSAAHPVADMGYVARYIGADIQLAANQSVTLDTGTVQIVLPKRANTSYEIFFGNECHSASCAGPDFHDLIDPLGSVGTYYDLAPKVPGPLSSPTGCCSAAEAHGIFSVLNTDPSPCMSAGFGGSNGFLP